MARITGIVKELITPKADITVFLYDRETGTLVDSTTSAIDGTFVFNDLDDTKRYTVTALSDNEAYNDGIDDNLEAVNDCDNNWDKVTLYLRFEGANNSTTFIDSSVYNNTITKTGTPIISTSSPAIGTSSGSFNGSSFLNLTNHTVTHLGSNNFTIEAWLKITSTLTTNYNVILCQRSGFSSLHNFTFLVNGPDLAGKLAFEFGSPTGGAPSITLTDSAVFPLNTWTHVAVTRRGNVFRLFKNGAIVSTAIYSGAGYASPSLPGIGRLPSGYNLNGGLAELRLTVGTARYIEDFSSSLQSEYFPILTCGTIVEPCDAHFSDVLLLLNGQTTITTDASSHNRTLLTSGTPTLDISTPLFGYPTYKIDYNVTEYVGISSDAFVASNFTNNEWCIEIWVRPTQTGVQYNFSYISQIILRWLDTGNFSASCTNIGGTSKTIATSSNLYTANTWYHIAYVRDNTDSVFSYLKLYVNGIHVATSTASSKSDVIGTGATFGRLIGYNNNGAAGNFTNLRITNNTARYYSNFSVPTEAFPVEQC